MAKEESRGKRPFKIWDGFRNIRKSLVASSLKDLEIRGKEKLKIAHNETVRLVLETDGTQIEDSEYFKTLPNNTTVLLLKNDEYWYPAGVDAIKTAIAAIPKIVCETIHALELQNETPSWKIMDNKGRVTVVLHWDQRNNSYRGSGNSGMDASPSKKMTHQQNGLSTTVLSMENSSSFKKESAEQNTYQYHQSVPASYRNNSTPQITVIHHDTIPLSMTDRLSNQQQRLSKQSSSSSLDAAAIHVHTSECTHYASSPHHYSTGIANGSGGLSRASSPARESPNTATATGGSLSPLPPLSPLPLPPHPSVDNVFECDFHCCALHEEGRQIAVHKSVATSPIQECHHHGPSAPPPPLTTTQPPASSMSDGTRRAPSKGHVRFLDTNNRSPPLLPPPLLSPKASAVTDLQQQQVRKSSSPLHQQSHRSDESSESETENTVIEDESMTSEKFLLLIDQLTGKQDKHLTVKDIGIILERLNSKIVDVERLDRDYDATDCYNWTIKATIRGDVLQELGIIYNGNYYGISEHPGYRQNDDELANEDDEEVLDEGTDDCIGDDDHRRANNEEVNI